MTDFKSTYYVSLIIGILLLALPLQAQPKTRLSRDSDLERYLHISDMSNKELYERGSKHVLNGETDSALIYYNLLINRYAPDMPENERHMIAEALLATGRLYYDNFSYTNAMQALLRCRRICEENHFSDILSDSYRYIGNIYSMHGDFERAISFYEKALSMADRANNADLSHKALSNLTGACIFMENISKAREYYTRLKASPIDTELYRFDLLIDGALIALYEGNKETAFKMFRQATDYTYSHNLDPKQKGTANSWMATAFSMENKPDSAMHYLKINERLARDSGQTDLLVETLHAMADIYKEQHNLPLYQKYLEEYLSLSEEIFNQKMFNSLKNAQFQYEVDKSDRIIRDLNAEHARQQTRIAVQRRTIWITGISLLLLSLLIIVIWRQKRTLSKAYSDLYARNKMLLHQEKQGKQLARSASATPQGATAHQDSSAPTTRSASSDISPELREQLLRAIEDVMENPAIFCDPEFSVARLAELVKSNSTYVSKIINETFEKNFRTYLNEYRIKESMSRLDDKEGYGHLTIKAIAESVGYKSQSAFIAAFTKYTGMKPSIYQGESRKQA